MINLSWGLKEIISFLRTGQEFFTEKGIVQIPTKFHSQVAEVKEYLALKEVSGLVNTMIDYFIDCAITDIEIVGDNGELVNELNVWLENINSAFRGKRIEVGIKGLFKQYLIERWQRSSLLVLRTVWTDGDNLILPTAMFYADGGSIHIEDDKETAMIGKEKYLLSVSPNSDKKIELPKLKKEEIFVQSPFAPWGDTYPIPFIVRRGILRNLKFYDETSKVVEKVVMKSIPYFLKVLKGDPQLALQGRGNYTEEDFEKLNKELKKFKDRAKTESGTPTLASFFDTKIDHIIPDYKKVLDTTLFAPIERRILEGLGLIEIVQGVGTTRKESIFNPRPAIKEIKQARKDFLAQLNDVLVFIKDKNSQKYKQSTIKIKIRPMTEFLTKDMLDHFRRMYERGGLSKRTYSILCGDNMVDFDYEVKQRTIELMEGLEELLYPPIIQNQEQYLTSEETDRKDTQPIEEEEVTDDKKGADKQDYIASDLKIASDLENTIAICPSCNHEFDYMKETEAGMGYVKCPKCGEPVTQNNLVIAKIYEEAPYKTPEELPESIKKVLTKKLQKVFTVILM